MESLKQQIAAMRQSFFDEELLDEFYIQIELIEELDNPNFLENIMTGFFRDSSNLLTTIEEDINKSPPDYLTLEKKLHKLKGSSGSVGANKIKIEVNQTREHLLAGNLEEAKASFEQLKQEQSNLKAKFDDYFQLLKQVGSAGPGTDDDPE